MFSFSARKRLVLNTFLSVLDYGDTISSLCLLKKFDAFYHSSLRFVTRVSSAQTYHWMLHSNFLRHCWADYSITLVLYWLSALFHIIQVTHLLLQFPTPRTEIGKTGFLSFAQHLCNDFHTFTSTCLKLGKIQPKEPNFSQISLNVFVGLFFVNFLKGQQLKPMLFYLWK